MNEATEINEIRYYLEIMKGAMKPQPLPDGMSEEQARELGWNGEPFKPTYLVTAVKLPNGAIELAINNTNIPEKIDYILEAYDENMHLKTNPEIVMQQLMVV
jgi:hypothetical protein